MDASFQTTIWALIRDARERRGPALDDLVRRYWEPIRRFVERRGFKAQDAEDVAQEVLAEVCRGDFLERADASKGRFRALLLAVTRHRMHSRLRDASTVRRGGDARVVPLDPATDATAEERNEYDRLWAAHIMRSSLDRVRELNAEYAQAIELHYLQEMPYAAIATRLGRKEYDVKNFIFQGKKRLKECVEQYIREYCSSPEELREELDELARFMP